MQSLQSRSEGMKTLPSGSLNFCGSCCEAKSTRKPFRNENVKAAAVFEVLYADLVGPFPVETPSGCRYSLGMTDKYSNYTWNFNIPRKSDAVQVIMTFIKTQEKEGRAFGNLQCFSTDNGTEFVNKNLQQFLAARGITHRTSPPYTPEFNAVQERMNRTVGEMANALLFQSGLPSNCWGLARDAATYIRNRCPCTSNPNGVTPYEMIKGSKPRVDHLRVFGAECFYHIPKQLRQGKLAPKAEPGTFAGYDEIHRAYRIIPHSNRNVIIFSRDVIFDEKSVVDKFVNTPSPPATPIFQLVSDQVQETEVREQVNPPSQQVLRRSNRERNPIDRLTYGHVAIVEEGDLHALAFNGILDTDDPVTLQHALEGDERIRWTEAISEEMTAHSENGTWEVEPTPVPHGAKVINTKFVFKKKLSADGTRIDRYKARLVAQGFNQRPGIDYGETFAPVVDKVSLRVFLSIAASERMHLEQFDVKTAFLYGAVDEELYILLPKELGNQPPENHAYKVIKALYGIKQAPRVWYNNLTDTMRTAGFSQNDKDPCLYIFREADDSIRAMFVVHVDDGILATASTDFLDEISNFLDTRYKMRRLGRPSSYLSLDMEWRSDVVVITQANYIRSLAEKYGVQQQHGTLLPMAPKAKLFSRTDQQPLTEKPYRELVGALIYISVCTRPDISYAVGKLATFFSNPTDGHYEAALKVLRYLNATSSLGLHLGGRRGNTDQSLTCYADSDFAEDEETRVSTSGFTIFLNSSLIAWGSKKQSTVATSTTEAEFLACTTALKETIWLQYLLLDLGYHNIVQKTILLQDNQSTIAIIQDQTSKGRTKHFDVKYKFVNRSLQNGLFILKYCPTEEMIADALTKALPRVQFQKLRESLLNT
jgi:hypothetical protein